MVLRMVTAVLPMGVTVPLEVGVIPSAEARVLVESAVTAAVAVGEAVQERMNPPPPGAGDKDAEVSCEDEMPAAVATADVSVLRFAGKVSDDGRATPIRFRLPALVVVTTPPFVLVAMDVWVGVNPVVLSALVS